MIDAAKVENLEPYQNRIKTETKFPSIPIDNRGVTKDCARFLRCLLRRRWQLLKDFIT